MSSWPEVPTELSGLVDWLFLPRSWSLACSILFTRVPLSERPIFFRCILFHLMIRPIQCSSSSPRPTSIQKGTNGYADTSHRPTFPMPPRSPLQAYPKLSARHSSYSVIQGYKVSSHQWEFWKSRTWKPKLLLRAREALQKVRCQVGQLKPALTFRQRHVPCDLLALALALYIPSLNQRLSNPATCILVLCLLQ